MSILLRAIIVAMRHGLLHQPISHFLWEISVSWVLADEITCNVTYGRTEQTFKGHITVKTFQFLEHIKRVRKIQQGWPRT